MLRAFDSWLRRWLIVTPPKPWRTITDGCPNAFRAKPWPSSWTRIETKLASIQIPTTSMPMSMYRSPQSPEITRKMGSTRTGMPAIEKWGRADTGESLRGIAGWGRATGGSYHDPDAPLHHVRDPSRG